jgi:hypothetical protein
MTTYRINIDLSNLQTAIEAQAATIGVALNHIVRSTAEGIRASWKHQVEQSLPGRDAYTLKRQADASDSIKHDKIGPFESEISSNHEAVIGLEEGFPARDLKQMLQTSSKTKVSKAGKKYLTIPMRHGTPGTTVLRPMPQATYDHAEQIAPSIVTGTAQR